MKTKWADPFKLAKEFQDLSGSFPSSSEAFLLIYDAHYFSIYSRGLIGFFFQFVSFKVTKNLAPAEIFINWVFSKCESPYIQQKYETKFRMHN